MTVAFKTALGNNGTAASSTTITITTTAAIAIGDLVVVRWASDNLNATTPTATCADGGNTYTVLRQGAVNATAAAGVAGGMLATKATVARPTSSTITLTLSGAVTAKAIYAESFTGAEITTRVAAVGATGTATAASAGATAAGIVAGDLVLGHIANETRGTITGDADTTGGAWSTQVSKSNATSGSDAVCVSVAGQYKIATASGAQTYNVTAVAAEWVCQCVVLQATPDPSITQAAYQFFDDAGTESGAAPLGALNTAITGNISAGDGFGVLRVRLQSTTAVAVPATDDFQLQYEKNASGSWINEGTGAVLAYDNPNLTAGAATTNRLGAGSGSFVAGKISETGDVSDMGWTANNYTELVYSLQLIAAQLANGDTLRFRVLRNGATTGMTYTQTPLVNLILLVPNVGTSTTSHGWAVSASGDAPNTGTSSASHTWAVSATGFTPLVAPTGARIFESGATVRLIESGAARVIEGAPGPPLEGSAVVGWSGTVAAVGKRIPEGAATTTWSETTAAAGKRIPKGTAPTTYVETVTGAGKRAPKGAAATTHSWVTAAAGVSPTVLPKTGSAAVTHTWALAAAGDSPPNLGTAATTYTEAAAAVGRRAPKGIAPTTTWTEVTGAAGKKVPKGAAATTWAVATAAAGKKTPKGASAPTYTETVSAVGKEAPKGQAAVTWTEATAAAGVKPIVGAKQGSAIVSSTWTTATTGRRLPKSAVTTTYTETATAAGRKVQSGAAATTWSVATTAAGKRIPKGAVTTTTTETLTAAGRRAPKATTVGAHAWSTFAQGVKPLVGVNQGSAFVTHGWATGAVGKRVAKSAQTLVVSWPVTAAGKKIQRGSASTNYVETPTAAGKRVPKGAVTTSFTETTGAVGKKVPKGATTPVAVTWITAAAGVRPVLGVKQGSALVTYAWGTSAVGRRTSSGISAVTITWAPTATGKKLQRGTTTVAYLWQPSAVGKKLQTGTASTTHLWLLAATGKKFQRSNIVVTYVWAVTAVGKRAPQTSSEVVYLFSVEVQGVSGVAGFVEGIWDGQGVVGMQYGDKAVIDWLMVPS